MMSSKRIIQSIYNNNCIQNYFKLQYSSSSSTSSSVFNKSAQQQQQQFKNKQPTLTKFQLIEKSYDYVLPPYQPIIIRLDGNSFKKLTKSLNLNNHDERFHESMKQTSITLCNYFIGCKLIYSFSDEINILVYNQYPQNQFLSNRIQKLISIASSITSVNFSNNLSNLLSPNDSNNNKINVSGYFDCRAFIIPYSDLNDYFDKRQKRCYSNCLSSIASANNIQLSSSGSGNENEIYKKDIITREKTLEKFGFNLSQYPEYYKKGFIIYKESFNNDNNIHQWKFKSCPNFKDHNYF